jgi:transposase
MQNTSYDILAADVSKNSLQIHGANLSFALPYDAAGLRKLLATLRKLPRPMVVCESTGGYERTLLETLAKASIPCRRVNPTLIRGFANSEGIKAKNDRIDARTIYRFAIEKKLQPQSPLPAHKQAMADLLDRRSHLCEQLAREKNRLQKAAPIIAKSIRDCLAFIHKQIDKIETAIRSHLTSHEDLRSQVKTFLSVKGVGEVTAWSLAAYLGEIASLSRNKLVALAGVAPFDKDSGITSSKRFIFGGRAKIRRCIYMAAHTAATHNDVIKPYVQGLLSRGKPYKCAIVAAMRKLLIHLQSLLKKSHQLSLAQ